MEYVRADSEKLPALGFGTYRLRGHVSVESVKDAILAGYRHIDTAEIYNNETETGEGVKLSGIPSEEVFITTKLWTNSLAPKSVRYTTERSLESIGSDYLDPLLIQWPSSQVPLEDTPGAMNLLKEQGNIRHLDVNNLNI